MLFKPLNKSLVGASLLAMAAGRLHTFQVGLPKLNAAQVETRYQWPALKVWQAAGPEDTAR